MCECLKVLLAGGFVQSNFLIPNQYFIYQLSKEGKRTSRLCLLEYCPKCGEKIEQQGGKIG